MPLQTIQTILAPFATYYLIHYVHFDQLPFLFGLLSTSNFLHNFILSQCSINLCKDVVNNVEHLLLAWFLKKVFSSVNYCQARKLN